MIFFWLESLSPSALFFQYIEIYCFFFFIDIFVFLCPLNSLVLLSVLIMIKTGLASYREGGGKSHLGAEVLTLLMSNPLRCQTPLPSPVFYWAGSGACFYTCTSG